MKVFFDGIKTCRFFTAFYLDMESKSCYDCLRDKEMVSLQLSQKGEKKRCIDVEKIIKKKRGRKPMEKVKKSNGRPPINQETKDLVVRLYNEDELTCIEIAKACNISKASVFRIMNERRAAVNGEEE